MASTLEYCLLEIQELERRIERLEFALSRSGQVSPPAPKRHLPQTVVMPAPAVLPVLQFEEEDPLPRAPQPVEVQAALEAYPRVLDRIRMLWFYPECEQLLDKLIIDDRGNRSGFNRDIMDELLFLARLSRAVKLSQGLSSSHNAAQNARRDVWEEHRIGRGA
jgi:hypothetical protein